MQLWDSIASNTLWVLGKARVASFNLDSHCCSRLAGRQVDSEDACEGCWEPQTMGRVYKFSGASFILYMFNTFQNICSKHHSCYRMYDSMWDKIHMGLERSPGARFEKLKSALPANGNHHQQPHCRTWREGLVYPTINPMFMERLNLYWYIKIV